MPHRLVLVDGFSILFRAFYGVPALTTAQGIPTNAVYGFATMLFRLLDNPETGALVVVFDAPSRTFRHDSDVNYKANRTAAPDELAAQIPLTRELLEAFNLPLLMVHGVEADDVIGSVAKRAGEAGWDVSIVTGDGDACQLVDEHIQVLCPRKGTDLVLMDVAAVREKYGIEPARLPDWKALSGDASDNIPGVPGMGPKTATTLLQQFGTVQELYERLDEVPKDRWRTLLQENRDKAFLSLHLAAIRTDVDIAMDLEGWRVPKPDWEKLGEFFTRLGMRSLLRKALADAPESSTLQHPIISVVGEQDYGAMTAAELPGFVAACLDPSQPQPIPIHLSEGAGGAPMIAISPRPGLARYLPSSEMEGARGFLEDPAVLKCFHDAKGAINRLKRVGINLDGVFVDTAIASYLVNPGRGHHRLDEVVFEILNVELAPARTQGSLFGDEEEEQVGESLCQIVDCVGQITGPLLDRVRSEGMETIFEEIEMPLASILASMERHGVAVDLPFLEEMSESLGKQIEALEKEIHEMVGYAFSINSPKQLQEVLFGKLQLSSGKATKTGFSTDAETLKALATAHPLPAKVLAYRELAKLKSTYTDAIPRLVDRKTCRVHTSLNQTVTATGRLSSSEPNLQNIPIRTSIGRELRRAFVAEKGHVLLSVDYSQIELRLLAHVAQDAELLRAFRNREDVHAHTAASIFGVRLDEVTGDMRRRAKTINFGLMYGMSSFGLAADLGLSRSEADKYIEQYFERFPGVKAYIANTIDQAQRTGYVTTLSGRRRYIPEINSRNRNFRQMAERAAINTPIQGTAADIMKLAMIRAHDVVTSEGVSARMILQVHDELVFELPPEEAPVVLPRIKTAMEEAMSLDVALLVDSRMGQNWGEMEAV